MGSRPRATGDHAKSKPAPRQAAKSATPGASAVIKAGNRRDSLQALRDTLADALEVAEPNVIAQIAGRLQAVMAEIDGLPELKKVSKADELASRRRARRATPHPPASSTGEGRE